MSFRRTTAAIAVTCVVAALAGCAGSKSASDVVAGAEKTSGSPRENGATGNNGSSGDSSRSDGKHLTAKSILPAMRHGLAGMTTVQVTMLMSGAASMRVSADMDTNSSDPAMDMTMNGAALGVKARFILVEGRLYVSSPTMPPGIFVSSDPNDPNDPLAASAKEMSESVSPGNQFKAWDAGLKSVSYVGRDSVQGQATQRYRITVTSSKALKAQGQPLTAGLPKSLTYDVWLDSDNRMRKIAFELADVTTTMLASGWGEPVDISKPPSRKIIGLG